MSPPSSGTPPEEGVRLFARYPTVAAEAEDPERWPPLVYSRGDLATSSHRRFELLCFLGGLERAAWLDYQIGECSVEPAGDPPVLVTQEFHRRRDEQHPQGCCVNGDGGGEAQSEDLAAMRASLHRWLSDDGRSRLPDHIVYCFDLLQAGFGDVDRPT